MSAEDLPEPINFQVKNILTIDGNILLEEIKEPAISGTNGTLYKLNGSNDLYWKTTGGIVNLISGASFPLLAPTGNTPQYSFSGFPTTGIFFENNILNFQINNNLFIQMDDILQQILISKDIHMNSNDIIYINEVNCNEVISQSINISSFSDTTDILKIDGHFNVYTNNINYTTISVTQNYNLTSDVNSTIVNIISQSKLNNNLGRINGGIVGFLSFADLNGLNDNIISPITKYIGYQDLGLRIYSDLQGLNIDNVYGIQIAGFPEPSMHNGGINNYYGVYIYNPTDPNIYNKYGIYSEIPNNYFSGINLQTQGGIQTSLNYYETGTFNLNVLGPWDEIITLAFTRIGKIVTIIFSTNVISRDVSSTYLSLYYLPARLFPSTNIYGLMYGVDNNINTTFSYIVQTDGQIFIGASPTNINGNFSAGIFITTGYYGTSISYLVS